MTTDTSPRNAFKSWTQIALCFAAAALVVLGIDQAITHPEVIQAGLDAFFERLTHTDNILWGLGDAMNGVHKILWWVGMISFLGNLFLLARIDLDTDGIWSARHSKPVLFSLTGILLVMWAGVLVRPETTFPGKAILNFLFVAPLVALFFWAITFYVTTVLIKLVFSKRKHEQREAVEYDGAAKTGTSNAQRELLTQIAQQHLAIETLEPRNRDRLDFHEVSVWGIEEALQAAFKAGADSQRPD